MSRFRSKQMSAFRLWVINRTIVPSIIWGQTLDVSSGHIALVPQETSASSPPSPVATSSFQNRECGMDVQSLPDSVQKGGPHKTASGVPTCRRLRNLRQPCLFQKVPAWGKLLAATTLQVQFLFSNGELPMPGVLNRESVSSTSLRIDTCRLRRWEKSQFFNWQAD